MELQRFMENETPLTFFITTQLTNRGSDQRNKDQYQVYSDNKIKQKSIKSNIKKPKYQATLTKLGKQLNKNQKSLNSIM